jgi:single-strand DNA-binding protein
LSIATSHRQKGKSGEWNNATEWHKVIVFDRVAENCQKYLKKGSQVYVEGRLQTRSYTGRDGIERKATEIVASQVKFLQGSREDERQTAVSKAIKQLDEDIPF